jgi:hypothetical protein
VSRRLLILAATTLTLLAAWAPPSFATFHEVSIREIYPGSVAKPGSEYVELQMWSSGQQFVSGHLIRTYDADGNPTGSDDFPTDLANGVNQSTMVLATPEAEAEFGFSADAALSPAGRLDPLGGAVCWEAIDCVAWGDFAGSLPNPVGSPAASGGIPDGMALRRTIAPGCATLLEATDDHDDSTTDFSPVFPAPRPNSIAPSERSCSAAAGGGAGSTGTTDPQNKNGAPQTALRHKPPRKSTDRTPTFRFGADEAGVSFECRVDSGVFRKCRSPFTTKRLSPGHHTFRVRARDASGLADPSPAIFGFSVLARPVG